MGKTREPEVSGRCKCGGIYALLSRHSGSGLTDNADEMEAVEIYSSLGFLVKLTSASTNVHRAVKTNNVEALFCLFRMLTEKRVFYVSGTELGFILLLNLAVCGLYSRDTF